MIDSKNFYNIVYDFLKSILPKGITEDDIKKYLIVDECNHISLKDLYEHLIYSAQNYQFMPNVIGFEKRREDIRKILKDFDYKAVKDFDIDKLYYKFRKVFSIDSPDSHKNSWYKWSCSVVDAAKYVNRFMSIEEFNHYVNEAENVVDIPIDISRNIRGIGFALACDALKELGYSNYVKPDIHMIDICDSLGFSDRKPINVFNAMIRIAEKCEVTPYALDKVLWLICSGYFYKEEIRIESHKYDLIDKLKSDISGIEETHHYSNSENPTIGALFQEQVKDWFTKMYNEKFEMEVKIPIGQPLKDHKFDIVCKERNIAIECKRYTWTESGNVPSAKLRGINEAAFFLSFLPDSYKKFIVIVKAYNSKKKIYLADYYHKTYKHLLGDITIAEYDPESGGFRIIS